MADIKYKQRFFYAKLPLANIENVKGYLSDQFGFDLECINVLRSHNGKTCYPLFMDEQNNYIVFTVNGIVFQCIDGELKLLEGRG